MVDSLALRVLRRNSHCWIYPPIVPVKSGRKLDCDGKAQIDAYHGETTGICQPAGGGGIVVIILAKSVRWIGQKLYALEATILILDNFQAFRARLAVSLSCLELIEWWDFHGIVQIHSIRIACSRKCDG